MNVKTPLLGSLLLLIAGCSAPSQTIRQLGHPVFEEVVGKDTLFKRADPEQRLGLDAFGDDVDDDANHSFIISFWPAGSDDKIGLEVRARAKGKLDLKDLAAAAFPITRQQGQRFEAIGELPEPTATPIGVSSKSETDESGNTVLYLFFPRSAVPAGTEWLAIPTLARFKDGWIHVRFYKTAVPAPMKLNVLPPGAIPIKKGEEPTKAEPTKAEPTKAEPTKAEPTKAEPTTTPPSDG